MCGLSAWERHRVELTLPFEPWGMYVCGWLVQAGVVRPVQPVVLPLVRPKVRC